MELYLEDIDMVRGPLHWNLPRGVEDPSSREQPHGAHRRIGELITIGPTSVRDNEDVDRVVRDDVERFCDEPREVVDVIGEFSNLTALYINCHSIDARGRSNAADRGTVAGIQLGGARIYTTSLSLFRNIRSSFIQLHRTEPSTYELMLAPHTYSIDSQRTREPVPFEFAVNLDYPFYDDTPAPTQETSPAPAEYRITAAGFNQNSHLFVPRIVMRSCSIGQNLQFCQTLADNANTWVFAPTVDQLASQTRATPWQLHGPVRVFIPVSLAQLQTTSSRRDLSPFRQRRGQQMAATGSGRGVGRRQGVIG